MASKINVTLGLDVSAFQKGLAQATAKLDAFSKRAQNLGSTLSQNVTLPLVGLGAAAVKSFVDIDKLERGMVAIMGSSEAAAAELTKLKEVAKLPGIGFKEAVQGSINLQAVGLSADEARTTISGFAKALAATGKGRVELEAIQYQLTQMISKNKILAEDYKVIQSNLPLMAAGLERAFGTSNIEAVRETGISAKEFTMRLSEALNTLPQVEKATGGLGNAFDNFGDSIQFSLAELGRSIATSLNLEAVLASLSGALSDVVEWFTQLSPSVQKTIVYFAVFAASIGPALFIVGKLAGAIPIIVQGFTALKSGVLAVGKALSFFTTSAGATVLAGVALVAVVAGLYYKFEGVRKVINAVGTAIVDVVKLAGNSFALVIKGFQQLKEGEFKAAAVSFGDALKVFDPITLGKTFAQGLAKGFEDDTNYIEKALTSLKGSVQKAQQDIFGSTAATAINTATGGGGGGGGGAALPSLNTSDYDKQLANLSSRLYDFANKMQKPFGFIRTALQDTFDVAPQISAQKDALLEYEKSIAKIAERAALLGENPLDAYLQETESALVSALETFGPTSEAVRVLKEEYDRLNLSLATNKETFDAQQESIAKQKDLVADYMGVVSGAFDTAAQSLAESAVTIKAVLSAVGKAALKAASDFLRAKIIEAVAAFIADSFKKFGVLGAVIGAAGGAAVGALFTAAVGKISGIKLATGGLAYGPTLATVGDNPNAISDPEVIAPLSKLKDYLNGGGGYIAETRISGNDLLILVSNAERRNGRIR